MRGVIRSLAAAVLTAAVLLVVPAVAQAGAPPSLAWSPTTSGGTYDYGAVTVGQTSSETFTLANSGGSARSALKITLSGSSAFSITADTCHSLGPRKSCTVAVSFAPASLGTDTATLAGVGNKPAATATLLLTGTGPAPGHIYWADLGNGGNGTVNAADLDGTNPQTLVSGFPPPGGENQPWGVAVDASDIYWTDFGTVGNGTVNKANLDGTNPQTLVTAQDLGQLFGAQPTGVAVDASHVYWADSFANKIYEANLDGTNPQTLFSGANGGVAVDASHIYWADIAAIGSGTVNEANLDGTDPHILVSGLTAPVGVAVDASHVYWADNLAGTINEANLDGTNRHSLVSNEQGVPTGVAVDASHIYWTDPFAGEIREANLNGSNPHTLVCGQTLPFGVAVSG